MFPLRLCRSKKLFSFHLQITTCLRSAVFHVEWTVLMWKWSLDIQTESSSVRKKSYKMRKSKGWRKEREERQNSVDWKTLISSFQQTKATELLKQGCRASRCSQGEVSALESSLDFPLPPSFFHFYHPATLSLSLQKNQYGCAKCSLAHGEGQLTAGPGCRLTARSRGIPHAYSTGSVKDRPEVQRTKARRLLFSTPHCLFISVFLCYHSLADSAR